MLPGGVKNHHMWSNPEGVTKLPDVRVTSLPWEIKNFWGLGSVFADVLSLRAPQ